MEPILTIMTRYKMLLVHFLAVALVSERKRKKTGTTLSATFCFLSKEDEANYTWALLAFRELVIYDLNVDV